MNDWNDDDWGKMFGITIKAPSEVSQEVVSSEVNLDTVSSTAKFALTIILFVIFSIVTLCSLVAIIWTCYKYFYSDQKADQFNRQGNVKKRTRTSRFDEDSVVVSRLRRSRLRPYRRGSRHHQRTSRSRRPTRRRSTMRRRRSTLQRPTVSRRRSSHHRVRSSDHRLRSRGSLLRPSPRKSRRSALLSIPMSPHSSRDHKGCYIPPIPKKSLAPVALPVVNPKLSAAPGSGSPAQASLPSTETATPGSVIESTPSLDLPTNSNAMPSIYGSSTIGADVIKTGSLTPK